MARSALRFADAHALQAALRLVPSTVQEEGGSVTRGADGSLTVVARLPAELREALVRAGAEAVPARAGRPFLHWAELVPLDRDEDPDLREVLFVLPPGTPWLPLAAELVRLGCDAQELADLGDEGVAILARRPPYYTVARAPDADWIVYARQGPAWVEVGWRHPFGGRLAVPDGAVLLLSPHGWRTAAVATWTDLAERLDLAVPPPEEVASAPPEGRLAVRLRLKPTPRAGPPTLWAPAPEALEALARQLPDAVVDRLLFARFEGGALLRARPGADPPVLEGLRAYAPHPQLGSVYVPEGRAVDPPLRPATLQALLDPGPDRIAWLEPDGDTFRVRRIADDAFHALADHVLYVADQEAEAVAAWLGSSVFDWEPLDLPVARERPASEEPAARATPRRERAPSAPERPPEAPAAAPRRAGRSVIVLPLAIADPAEAERELLALQARWREDPTRDRLWASMAELHHALDQPREATICWARALWDADDGVADRWADRTPLPASLPAAPDAAALGAVLAHVVAGRAAWDAPALQRWLDAHDHALDVRSRWLGRRRVAELADRDALALARARDAVLGSIRSGLVPARDLPAFLRTSATPEERRLLAASLATLPERLEPAIPRCAPAGCTRAYLRLIVGWAEACLGLTERATEALATAERALPTGDPVHAVLFGLYRSGIEEALAGLPAETPPPADVVEALNRLERFDRYKVDRLRDQSVAVLVETGTADAFASWVRGEARPSLGTLPAEELLPAIRACLDGLDEDEPLEGLLQALNAVPALGEADAATVLDEIVERAAGLAASDRVPVLVEAVSIAAALRRPGAAQAALPALEAGLQALLRHEPPSVVGPARELARALARCGLGGEARALFGALRESAPAEARVVRLRLAGALAQVGGSTGDDAREALGMLRRGLSRGDRLAVVAATADLAAPLPVADALALWGALLPHAAIEDGFSTNTHFALSFLQLTEIVAAAHVHPDRLLGPEGRAWIDADEQRVRTRIHREDRF